jgi:hypothetical protein
LFVKRVVILNPKQGNHRRPILSFLNKRIKLKPDVNLHTSKSPTLKDLPSIDAHAKEDDKR